MHTNFPQDTNTGFMAWRTGKAKRCIGPGGGPFRRSKPAGMFSGLRWWLPYKLSDGPEGLKVRLSLNNKLLDELHFFNGSVKPTYYYLPGIKDKDVEIEIEVDKTFNPFREGLSGDPRELGVAVSPISFLKIMPNDGIGFYAWENVDGEEGKETPKKHPLKFRRTGRQASINLRKEFRGGGNNLAKVRTSRY